MRRAVAGLAVAGLVFGLAPLVAGGWSAGNDPTPPPADASHPDARIDGASDGATPADSRADAPPPDTGGGEDATEEDSGGEMDGGVEDSGPADTGPTDAGP